jgi:hypothetical protein
MQPHVNLSARNAVLLSRSPSRSRHNGQDQDNVPLVRELAF